MKFSVKTLLSVSVCALLLSACQSSPKNTKQEILVLELPAPAVLESNISASATPMIKAQSFPTTLAMAERAYLIEALPTPIQNTEKYQHLSQNPVKSVASEPVSTFGADVDTGSYTNVRRFLNEGRLPPVDAVRAEEFINYFNYHYPKPTNDKPFAVHTTLTDSPFKTGAKILRIGIQGKETSKEALPPANLVFLVDVSGSMIYENKLPLVKHTLRTLTNELREIDSVSIITYANGETLALPATYATKAGKQEMLRVINSLTADGGTAGEQAIQMAYQEAQKHHKKDGINRILLMTDGDFNVGVTDFNTLKGMVSEKRKSGVSLSTFGFGTGNYNEQLMEQLADAGDGNYSYIDSKNEAKKVLHRQLSSTLATIAQDVKIQVEFNPATVKEYRLIGYENRALNEEDFKNDNVDSGDIGAGHAVTALYEIIPVGVSGYLSDRRYQPAEKSTNTAGEYAQLAIRYKLPNEKKSQQITHLITPALYQDKADDDTRLAIAVAGFAELLKGGKYAGELDFEGVLAMLNDIKGKDEYGMKEELKELIGIAEGLSTQTNHK